nr:DUF1462 family protein [Hazenella coriacea]
MKALEVCVYGTDQLCPSCIHAPSSRETASWLEAALIRKYGSNVHIRYIDLEKPESPEELAFSKKVIEEDLWYPVVVINKEIVAEGVPKLKDIISAIERQGIIHTS